MLARTSCLRRRRPSRRPARHVPRDGATCRRTSAHTLDGRLGGASSLGARGQRCHIARSPRFLRGDAESEHGCANLTLWCSQQYAAPVASPSACTCRPPPATCSCWRPGRFQLCGRHPLRGPPWPVPTMPHPLQEWPCLPVVPRHLLVHLSSAAGMGAGGRAHQPKRGRDHTEVHLNDDDFSSRRS